MKFVLMDFAKRKEEKTHALQILIAKMASNVQMESVREKMIASNY